MRAPRALLCHALAGDPDVCARLVAARELMDLAAREELAGAAVDPAAPALLRHLRRLLGGSAHEKLHAVFLDGRDRYLADECVADGAVGGIAASLRPLLTRALELGAGGLLLAHNHPSGSPAPSRTDIDTTSMIRKITEALEIRLVDHLIVTTDEVYSMRGGGLL